MTAACPRWTVLLVAMLAWTATVMPSVSSQAGEDSFLDPVEGHVTLRGDLHAHTAFSDGEGLPGQAFEQAASAGLDFFAVTEHAEWLLFPFRADQACIGPQGLECMATPLPEQTEYERVGEAAREASGDGFVGLRGFEWSSPVEGHVNVFGTELWTDTIQTAPAPMGPFYAWLAGQRTDPQRVASFNHPDRGPLMFDRFAYHPPIDPYMGTIEAFNRHDGHTDAVLEALDAGWHVGTIGVSDGHGPQTWTDPDRGHTVLFAEDRSRSAILTALAEHRTIATLGDDIDARFTVEDTLLGGSVHVEDPSQRVFADYHLLDAGGEPFTRVDLLGPQGFQTTRAPIGQAETNGFFSVQVDELPTTLTGERYLTLRAWQGDRAVLMTSPVWITTPDSGPTGAS